jgi:uncharacterized flavoprotein (TIGR03862 family)
MVTQKRTAAVVGAGPAGLMAAEVLAAGGVRVTVYERMPSVGRKFLMAGRGGLNITHSDDLERFLTRYGTARPKLRAAIEAFTPQALRVWCDALGQNTFIGTSGRVFPKAMKSSPLLRAWLRRLAASEVTFKPRHKWTGWDASGALTFDTPDGSIKMTPDVTVLALGGASWPKLGSDGGWADPLVAAGVALAPLRPANCGFAVGWSEVFRQRFAGQPLKRVELSFNGERVRGEVTIAGYGIEGGAVYALYARLRDAILASGEATLHIALRPEMTIDQLRKRLEYPRGKDSFSNYLRKVLSLSPAAIGLLHEAAVASSRKLADMTPAAHAKLINGIPLRLTGTAPIASAISTAGGVTFDALDGSYMLRAKPGVFAAGEMLDWEAPTGGFLLQASFATGAAAGRGALEWLKR